jgi:hypothetical protein
MSLGVCCHGSGMVFQFLFSLGQVFEGYFGEEYDEDAIRNNFTLVYELLDGNTMSPHFRLVFGC